MFRQSWEQKAASSLAVAGFLNLPLCLLPAKHKPVQTYTACAQYTHIHIYNIQIYMYSPIIRSIPFFSTSDFLFRLFMGQRLKIEMLHMGNWDEILDYLEVSYFQFHAIYWV